MAAGFSYILIMYASPEQGQVESTVIEWDSTMRVAYSITQIVACTTSIVSSLMFDEVQHNQR